MNQLTWEGLASVPPVDLASTLLLIAVGLYLSFYSGTRA